MRKKNFSWRNFSYEFIRAIVYGKQTNEKFRPVVEYKELDFLLPYMDRICSYPGDAFVRKYRKEIETYFFDGTNHLVRVVRELEKIRYGGLETGTNQEMLSTLSKKRMTQTLCDAYLQEIRMTGCNLPEEELSLFQVPKVLDLTTAVPDEVSLYPYQKMAVEAMKQYFITEEQRAAILSMPTGSGKTRTSVYFLLHDMISAGYQIIWLTHRSMLIDQAAEQFYTFAPLIREKNPKIREFKMVCISGKHANIRALQEDDDLIISSVQSMCNNTIYLPNILKEKVMIVVDEAHHTLAPSYRRIIREIRKCRPNTKLLGLTATPVRLTENATMSLMKLFDNKIVYSVAMSELIANGILARPKYISVDTNIDIESMIDIDERKYIQKWGELPESLIAKVAKTNERNDLIVEEYIKNRDKYGKTIIFALNAIHCDTLNEALRARGIRSAYVYSLIGNAENQQIIDRFRNNEGEDGIDVLININILTEGSDIPDIQTVFLTRPTTSDALLMQMVGRGMRGLNCGGTETVNIIDFCDKWDSITSWLNPQFLFGDGEEEDWPTRIPERNCLIPMAAIRDIVKGISYKGEFAQARKASLPVGWYDVIDEDGIDVKILVFENQIDGYRNFKDDYENYLDDEQVRGIDLVLKYFSTVGLLPGVGELESMLNYIRQERVYPKMQYFEERKQIEPISLAQKIQVDGMSHHNAMKLISDVFEKNKKLILSLYGNFDYYKDRIVECMLYPKGIIPVRTRIEEVDKSVYQLSPEPMKEDIEDLLTEVIEEQGDKFPENFIRPRINWSRQVVASYFGIFYHDYNLIIINSLLNSVSIPKEAVKFVIYHECLHQEIMGHPKEFREKERMYPEFQKQENFLDYTLRDFDIKEAM